MRTSLSSTPRSQDDFVSNLDVGSNIGTSKRPSKQQQQLQQQQRTTAIASVKTKDIDRVFLISTIIAASTWISLLLIVYFFIPAKYWEKLPDVERNAPQAAAVLQSTIFAVLFFHSMLTQCTATSRYSVGSESTTRAAESSSTTTETETPTGTTAASSAETSTNWYQGFTRNKWLSFLSSSHPSSPTIPGRQATTDSTTSSGSTSGFLYGVLPEGSGIIIAGFAVQIISFATNTLLAYSLNPVMIDPVTCSRIYLFRWCEWIPLSGFMTFLSECIDVHIPSQPKVDDNQNANGLQNANNMSTQVIFRVMPSNETQRSDDKSEFSNDNSKNTTDVDVTSNVTDTTNTINTTNATNSPSGPNDIFHGEAILNMDGYDSNNIDDDPIGLSTVFTWSMTQTASTICGIIFPFCTDIITWNLVMLFSMVTYFCLFPRVFLRRRLYLDLLLLEQQQQQMQQKKNATINDQIHKYRRSASDQNRKSRNVVPSNKTLQRSSFMLKEQELIQRRRFSFYLLSTCCSMWTLLVVFYFLNMMVHLYPSIIGKPAGAAIWFDTTFDACAKIVYMRLIIDVHKNVLEPNGRVLRQLHELRRLVHSIWECSSDVIVISVRVDPNKVLSVLSPALVNLLASDGHYLSNFVRTSTGTDISSQESTPLGKNTKSKGALMLELYIPTPESDIDSNGRSMNNAPYVISAAFVDSFSMTIPPSSHSNETLLAPREFHNDHTITEASRFVLKSWNYHDIDGGDNVIPPVRTSSFQPSKQSMLQYHQTSTYSGEKVLCEIKVSKHGENIAVAVVRDVRERELRFQAEQNAHSETLARLRDAQTANRFTRHEVKNGLLAGIELCNNLRESFDRLKDSLVTELEQASTELLNESINVLGDSTGSGLPQVASGTDSPLLNDCIQTLKERLDGILQEAVAKKVIELDTTLHDLLETTLAEAMAREIVNEVYVPRIERVSISRLLEGPCIRNSQHRLLMEIVDQHKIPELLLDIQLLKYIHWSAVLSACKYGKQNGIVSTKVWYDEKAQMLSLQVCNEPGPAHKELLDMSTRDEAGMHIAIFEHGARSKTFLAAIGNVNDDIHPDYARDESWVLQKCATVMGGTCSIKFVPTMTVFTFSFRAPPAARKVKPTNIEGFLVPRSTWGIAFDDSRIQRKIMDRILVTIGVEDGKRSLHGQEPAEIAALGDIITKILLEDETSRVLVLMDENLDYLGADNVPILLSGSAALKQILSGLPIEHELRVLALIRSANDSAEELSLYADRCHGFVPKAVMQSDRIREIIAQQWERRFHVTSMTNES